MLARDWRCLLQSCSLGPFGFATERIVDLGSKLGRKAGFRGRTIAPGGSGRGRRHFFTDEEKICKADDSEQSSRLQG